MRSFAHFCLFLLINVCVGRDHHYPIQSTMPSIHYTLIVAMIICSGCGALLIVFVLSQTVFHMCCKPNSKLSAIPKCLKLLYIATFLMNLLTCICYGLFKTNMLWHSIFATFSCNFVYFLGIGSYALSKYFRYTVFLLKIFHTFRDSALEYKSSHLWALFVCLSITLWVLFCGWIVLVVINDGIVFANIANHANIIMCMNHSTSATDGHSFYFLAAFGMCDCFFSVVMVAMFVSKLAKLRSMQSSNNAISPNPLSPRTVNRITFGHRQNSNEPGARSPVKVKVQLTLQAPKAGSPNTPHAQRPSLSFGDTMRRMSDRMRRYDQVLERQKSNRYQAELTKLIKKETCLVTVAIFSSFVCFFGGAFVFNGITLVLVPVDSTITCLCLFLMFANATAFWDVLSQCVCGLHAIIKYYLCCCIYVRCQSDSNDSKLDIHIDI